MSDDDLKALLEANAAETRRHVEAHAAIDRRVRVLESGFAELKARVERLEGCAH